MIKRILVLCMLLSSIVVQAQQIKDADRLNWWKDAKFGMFIHWGVYSQWGGVYHGNRQAKGGAEWIMNRCKIPVQEYRDSAKSFNPINYDPDSWVLLAKNAGMKYIIITAKHHDGFSLFDSKASNFNIVKATKYGKDLLMPLAEACKRHGLRLGFYYSQAQDWNNPGGVAARKEMKEGWPNPDSSEIDDFTLKHDGHWDSLQMSRSFEEYIDSVSVPQVKELLSNYGEISILWWDTPVHMTDDAANKLKNVLALQPNIITNDRLKRPNFQGDTKTPEQKIPTREELDGSNWESCMTMNNSWGYNSWDNNWKSPDTLIRNLVDIVSKGGNYLLNIGPKADGSIPEESLQRLQAVGKWMNVNNEAIYDTQPNPLTSYDWGRITAKRGAQITTLYLIIFEWPKDHKIILKDLRNRVVKANLLLDNSKVKAFNDNGQVVLTLPKIEPDKVATVIKLELNGQVKDILVHEANRKLDSGELD